MNEPLKMIVTADTTPAGRAFTEIGNSGPEVSVPDHSGMIIDHRTIAELERRILDVLAEYPVVVDPETGLEYHENAVEMAYTFSRMFGKRWIRIVKGYL